MPGPARIFALCLLAVPPGIAAAAGPDAAPQEASSPRLYQWADARTGRVHLAGRPPAWYRHPDGHGPRVLVFEAGTLIDDTGVAVSSELAAALRAESALRAAQASAGDAGTSPLADAPPVADPRTEPEGEALPAPMAAEAPALDVVPSVDETALRLRALLDVFDRSRAETARAMVEAMLGGAPAQSTPATAPAATSGTTTPPTAPAATSGTTTPATAPAATSGAAATP